MLGAKEGVVADGLVADYPAFGVKVNIIRDDLLFGRIERQEQRWREASTALLSGAAASRHALVW